LGGNIFNKLEKQGRMGKIISVSLAPFCRQFSPSNAYPSDRQAYFWEKMVLSPVFQAFFTPQNTKQSDKFGRDFLGVMFFPSH